jgi:hypothetical protein
MAEVNTYNDYSIASREEYPLISNMSFMLKPQVGADLFDVNPMESDVGDMMQMGLMKEVFGEEMIHHEANKRFDAPFVNSSATQALVYGVASGGNGDPTAYTGLDYIQLAGVSHSPQTGANALKYSSPRVGNLIQWKNLAVWRVTGKRETVPGSHRLYLTKLRSGDASLANTITLSGGVYGGDQFSVFTTAFEEATYGMLKGLVPTTKTYTNYLQSFYDFYDITDFQEKNETYPLNWQGKTLNFVYPKGISDTEMRFSVNEAMGLFLTPRNDQDVAAIDVNGNQTGLVTTTQGYMPNLELNAQKMYYDDVPTVNLFKQIIRLRRKLHQGPDCLMQVGYEFYLSASDIITQFGVNGAIVYNRQAVDLNINQINIGNFKFNIKELRILNHPDFTAIPQFPYPYYYIIAPMDKMKDPKTNIMRDAFCIMYKKQVGRGARGHYKIWETGGNSEAGTDGQLIRRVHMATRKGMQVVAASKFILGKRIQAA